MEYLLQIQRQESGKSSPSWSGKTYLLGPMMSLNQACDTDHANPPHPHFLVPAYCAGS